MEPHTPVLLKEVLEFLAIKKDGVYLDATCGGAGHSQLILQNLGPEGRLIAIDQDLSALKIAKNRLKSSSGAITYHHENFSRLKKVLDELKIESIDGVLADIGVSSMQLDDPERGFSYKSPFEVDMRMDATRGQTAAQLLRRVDPGELARIISTYGQQVHGKRIARRICDAVAEGAELTGINLREIVHKALPAKLIRTAKIEPSVRVFQALRIAVNDELGALERFLNGAHDRLAPGGRMVIISFHSLEDRIVKRFFNYRRNPCSCPRELPMCVCEEKPSLKILTRKPVTAGDREKGQNPRARSAKLRAAKKI